jgi:multiple sugar transport system substrate-binding protein
MKGLRRSVATPVAKKPRGLAGCVGVVRSVATPVATNSVVRSLLVLLPLLALTLLLACGREEEADVVFWQFQSPEVMDGIIADFRAGHPSIKVRMETLTWQSGYEKIIMAFASGETPDLLEVGSTWLPKFEDEQAILDVTDGTEDLASRLMMWDMATFGGRRFGIPWLIGTRVLFYNRDLFRRNGLSPDRPPETWSELRDAARAIHRPDYGINGFGMNAGERYVLYKKFLPFAWGNGGKVLSDDYTSCVIDSPANLEALEFYLSLEPYSILERQDMIDDMFKQGTIGMMISGGWNLERIPEDAPDLDFGVALIPKPDEGGFHASFAGAEILVFPKKSRIEPALELARFLVGAEQALKVSSYAKGVQPASREALEQPYYDEHPMERLLLRQCETSIAPPPIADWIEIEEIINTRLEECLYGKISAPEALKLMQDEVNATIAK